MLPRPVVIDCIEFCSDLRRLDILDELSFLGMEADYAGHRDIGDRIVEHYCQTTGDQPPASLLAFYKSYRACVRAKVCALRERRSADQIARPSSRARAIIWPSRNGISTNWGGRC